MADRQGPMRSCVGCKQRAAKTDLLRLVVVVGDEAGKPVRVVPDPSGRRPGRGASLHPDQRCLDQAVRRRAFPRAFRLPGPLDTTAVRSYLESRQREAAAPSSAAAPSNVAARGNAAGQGRASAPADAS